MKLGEPYFWNTAAGNMRWWRAVYALDESVLFRCPDDFAAGTGGRKHTYSPDNIGQVGFGYFSFPYEPPKRRVLIDFWR